MGMRAFARILCWGSAKRVLRDTDLNKDAVMERVLPHGEQPRVHRQ